jgi:glutamate synthase (NADPH/NADH) small chain
MPYLKQQNKRVAGKDPFEEGEIESNVFEQTIDAKGKNVIVIGGGDTGSDCVGTSNRQSALSVTQYELLPRPPESRNIFMPWPSYPMIFRASSSHEEGCERQWAIATKEFVGDDDGNLLALKIVDLEWRFTEEGKPAQFVERPGSEREIPCELALLAMGFISPQKEGMINELGIELDERSNVRATEKEFQSSIPKIFACGDMRRGQSLVVWALSEGRECARNVDEFLMGNSLLETKDSNLLEL